jgi:hypothetical protein
MPVSRKPLLREQIATGAPIQIPDAHWLGECYDNGAVACEARSPSGKAKVCKTFNGGSIPPRASS